MRGNRRKREIMGDRKLMKIEDLGDGRTRKRKKKENKNKFEERMEEVGKKKERIYE